MESDSAGGKIRLTPPLLDFRRVTMMRGGRAVLREVDLQIGSGEHAAILGPNGSGKSTLIRTITRTDYPVQAPGSCLTLLGGDTWNVFEFRRRLEIVTADALEHAVEWLTGFDLTVSACFSSIGIRGDRERITLEMSARAEAALDRLEALHLADRPVREGSSGELRRVQIARTLVHQPATLLLDEPSANLDLHAQAELRRILGGLAGQGVGLVLVTRHLADIIPEITRVILLSEGRVVADGRKDTLLTAERLSGLFGTCVTIVRRDGYYHAG